MRLGVVLQAHARERTLPAVLTQIATLRTLVDTRVVTLLDRPTEAVARLVADAMGGNDVTIPVPFRVVDERERFGESQNLALSVFERAPVDWVLWAPDDLTFEPGWETEFVAALAADDTDVWFVRSLFYWSADRIRLDIFPVCDPLLWRWRSGVRYDDRRQLLAPPAIVEQARLRGRVRIFGPRALDRGFATVEDRDRCWQRARRLGKLDNYTTALVTDPQILVGYDEIKDRRDIPKGTC